MRKLIRRTTFLILFIAGTFAVHVLAGALAEWTGNLQMEKKDEPAAVLHVQGVTQEPEMSRLERLKLFYRLGE